MGNGGITPPFFASALDGGGWLVSRPCHFASSERASGVHRTGWVGSRACLDAVDKKKISCPWRELNPGRLDCSRCYTDSAISALYTRLNIVAHILTTKYFKMELISFYYTRLGFSSFILTEFSNINSAFTFRFLDKWYVSSPTEPPCFKNPNTRSNTGAESVRTLNVWHFTYINTILI
jgi:hypothetical protein